MVVPDSGLVFTQWLIQSFCAGRVRHFPVVRGDPAAPAPACGIDLPPCQSPDCGCALLSTALASFRVEPRAAGSTFPVVRWLHSGVREKPGSPAIGQPPDLHRWPAEMIVCTGPGIHVVPRAWPAARSVFADSVQKPLRHAVPAISQPALQVSFFLSVSWHAKPKPSVVPTTVHSRLPLLPSRFAPREVARPAILFGQSTRWCICCCRKRLNCGCMFIASSTRGSLPC